MRPVGVLVRVARSSPPHHFVMHVWLEYVHVCSYMYMYMYSHICLHVCSNRCVEYAPLPSSTGVFSFFKTLTGGKTITRQAMEPALEHMKDHLITKNVAVEIADKLCNSVASKLDGKIVGTFTGEWCNVYGPSVIGASTGCHLSLSHRYPESGEGQYGGESGADPQPQTQSRHSQGRDGG